eukprot:m.631030 g.631030  ORF g.631030 m.631030 type:complete len:637 (-) comp22569_c0_seq2:307-2217(-)
MAVRCLHCTPTAEMTVLTLEQTPEYTVGWACDDCGFRSTVDPELPRSRQRFHCRACGDDICILCGRKRAKANGDEAPEIPALPRLPGTKLENAGSRVDPTHDADGTLLMTSLHAQSFDHGPDPPHKGWEGVRRTSVESRDVMVEAGAVGAAFGGDSGKNSSGDIRNGGDDPNGEVARLEKKYRNPRRESSYSRKAREAEDNSHAAWFSAAKKQWRESTDAPSVGSDAARSTGGDTEEDMGTVATVPTEIDIVMPSYSKAPAGHIVYAIKVTELGARGSSWTMLKRYNEFHALERIINKGLKYSKFPPDLKVLPEFPKKQRSPNLDKRKYKLERWLRDVVSKVSLHVCDDASARATGLFLGLRASVYLSAIDQNKVDAAEPPPPPLPVFKLPSPNGNGEVVIKRGYTQGATTPVDGSSSESGSLPWMAPSAPGSAGGPTSHISASPLGTQRTDVHGTTVAIDGLDDSYVLVESEHAVSDAIPVSSDGGARPRAPRPPSVSPAATPPPRALSSYGPSQKAVPPQNDSPAQKLYEAKLLLGEGLIGENDYAFARQTILDSIIESPNTPNADKLRRAQRLLTRGLITTTEYGSVKKGVLQLSGPPTAALLASRATPRSGRTSPNTTDSSYKSLESSPPKM